jgi:hypothetical protein
MPEALSLRTRLRTRTHMSDDEFTKWKEEKAAAKAAQEVKPSTVNPQHR